MASESSSQFVAHRPAPALRPYLAGYVGYREVGIPPGRHRGLPSPYLTMIVTLDEPLVMAAHPDPAAPPGRYDTLVGGLHTAPALVEHDGRQSGVQLALSPLGARALLGLPAGELTNIDLDAGALLGPLAGELHERIRAARTWAERFAVLDGLLLRRLDVERRLPPGLVWAWRQLLVTGGGVSVSELAREIGWSSRYLSRCFGVEIGLSPKRAARVVRFDRARRLLQHRVDAGRFGGLAEVAATTGYYDQAHLDRDFRVFAGCSPSRWLAEEFRPPDDLVVGGGVEELRSSETSKPSRRPERQTRRHDS
jgi:AraC-like DNA-binding protein